MTDPRSDAEARYDALVARWDKAATALTRSVYGGKEGILAQVELHFAGNALADVLRASAPPAITADDVHEAMKASVERSTFPVDDEVFANIGERTVIRFGAVAKFLNERLGASAPRQETPSPVIGGRHDFVNVAPNRAVCIVCGMALAEYQQLQASLKCVAAPPPEER